MTIEYHSSLKMAYNALGSLFTVLLWLMNYCFFARPFSYLPFTFHRAVLLL